MKKLLPVLALSAAACTPMAERVNSAATASAQAEAVPDVPVITAPVATPARNSISADWAGPYDGVPNWTAVNRADWPAAFERVMAQARAEHEAIVTNPAPATFNNTIKSYELAGDLADRVFSIWGVQTSNLSNAEMRALEKEWEPKISAFFSALSLDPRYSSRVKAVYDGRATAGLDPLQMRLLERTYDSMVRNGALLDAEKRAQLISLNTQLAGKFSEFSAKLLADEESYTLFTNPRDLAGLPASQLAAYRAAAVERQLEGWAVVNTRSAVSPFLENVSNRAARERVWRAFTMRGDNGNANDTKGTIAEILQLRAQRAALLGFDTHADFRMADTMAVDPDKGMDLMMKVWSPAVARVQQEVAEMQAIANRERARITIAPWDYRYYGEKLRKEKYDLDQAALKPYFELDNMVAAAFDAANRLYGMTFTENTGSVPVFHPDVRTFEVQRDGRVIGLFYLDNYARTGKRSGAWMTTYRSQAVVDGGRYVLASNNNNFTKGAPGEKVLISLDDASTLFHEFGHALHYLNYNITWPGLSETPRDFVEYPSQVNENWLMTPYILNKYAKHYQTGEPIPQALVDKIEASSTFMQGFSTVEFLASAILDMKLHNRPDAVTDIAAFERDTLREIGMPAEMVMRHRLTQFGHLFSSDAYSAGYYSYLWSEVMDSDTWAAFEETGDVWDKATAERFRSLLLATGNETDRAAAYRAFRGRDPDANALLRRRGFPVPGEAAGNK